MYIVRQHNKRHKIFIEEPYEVVQRETEEETLRYNMQALTATVERYVREYPTEWAWMHRRWKTRPGQKKVEV